VRVTPLLDPVLNYAVLGLTIPADLSLSKHIKDITSESKHASTDTICTFILQLCGHIWSMLVKFGTPTWLKNCQMIKSVQKFASKVCLKQWSRNTKYQDMLEFLNMPSLAAHRRQMKLCTLYKIVNNVSKYPSPPLIPRNPYYPSRSIHCLSFVRPYAHTNQYF